MANSRFKILIPMLALCFVAVSAYGQAALSLGSNPTKVRSEGITEVVGLITLSNVGAAAQVIPGGTTIIVQFDGQITNGTGGSTALVTTLIGVAGPPPTGNVYTVGTGSSSMAGNVVAGTATATSLGTTLTITIPANYGNDGTGACLAGVAPATLTTLCLVPGGGLFIQGIRVNVSGLVGAINATLTTVPANALTFPTGGNQTVVGRAQATLAGPTVTASSLPQCTVPTAPGATPLLTFFNATGTALGAGAPAAYAGTLSTIAVAESANFPTAFNAANSNSPAPASAWDEAGLTPLALEGNAPLPTKGVQLIYTFSGIPTGFSLIVPQTFTATTTTSSLIMVQQGLAAAAVAGAGSVIGSTGGAATVIYEVISTGPTSPTIQDTVTLLVAFTAPTGNTNVPGSLGAVNISVGPTSSVVVFSTTAVVLRFVQGQAGINGSPIGNITGCQTNLLFPFVSNRAGTTFNTGLAISNTALDSGTTKGETGNVTLFFYGISAPTGGAAGITLTAAQVPDVAGGGTVATAGSVAPGEHIVLALNNGTTSGLAPGFQGYIVALCNFRYAHGLATIFDNFGVGAANVGFSYMPLVLNGSTTARTGAKNVIGVGPDAVGLGN